ncbi:MAG: DNA methyltransferase, partial [Myxococcota bacterium]
LVEKTLSNRDPERTGYPTQKPLALATRIIQASLPPDGRMLDLMAGSGTVGIAALLLGRDAVLGDQSPVALDVARGRAVAAGAKIRLERVEPQDPLVDIPVAPVLLQRSSERNQARLTTLNLPLWTDRLGDGVTDAWLRTCASTRGTDLLGAWGVAEDRGCTGLVALAWWDGAAPRTREAVRQELSWSMGSETGAPLWWVGYDVAGRGFRSRIT